MKTLLHYLINIISQQCHHYHYYYLFVCLFFLPVIDDHACRRMEGRGRRGRDGGEGQVAKAPICLSLVIVRGRTSKILHSKIWMWYYVGGTWQVGARGVLWAQAGDTWPPGGAARLGGGEWKKQIYWNIFKWGLKLRMFQMWGYYSF